MYLPVQLRACASCLERGLRSTGRVLALDLAAASAFETRVLMTPKNGRQDNELSHRTRVFLEQSSPVL